jgi:hypothetical protein
MGGGGLRSPSSSKFKVRVGWLALPAALAVDRVDGCNRKSYISVRILLTGTCSPLTLVAAAADFEALDLAAFGMLTSERSSAGRVVGRMKKD